MSGEDDPLTYAAYDAEFPEAVDLDGPELPTTFDWAEFVSYHCRFPRCNEPCLNHVRTCYAQTKLRRECYRETEIEELPIKVDHLPEWARYLDPSAPPEPGG